MGYSRIEECIAETATLYGPYWFEDENERPQAVNTERYVAVLMKFWASLERHRRIDGDKQWFQQDGATLHTSNDSLAWLRKRFQERLISRKCDVEWAPHSSDLNPIFYLRGYLRDNVYQNNLQTIGELKAAITESVREITQKSRKSLKRYVFE